MRRMPHAIVSAAPTGVVRRAVRTTLVALALLGGLGAWARPVLAQAAPRQVELDHLTSEVARLRTELSRTNAEVEALKRDGRGVRDDFRLREKMADAESLARRLTEAEGRLAKARGVTGAPAAARPVTLPNAAPSDGPAELEAKADILADQARRLTVEADRLARSSESIRSRETLRRRSGQLERDPFFGFESSKRALQFTGGPRALQAPSGNDSKETARDVGTVAPTVPRNLPAPVPMAGGDRGSALSPPGTNDNAAPGNPPYTSGGPETGKAGGNPGTESGSSTGAPARDQGPASPTSGPGTAPATPNAPTGPTTLTVSQRALLDQATLAELQRLEADGRPLSRAEALARAAAALRARASQLENESKSLRVRAKSR